ncbi:aspartic protease 1 [Aphelenchoides avenae]|nr:aspartic protease 1 [Aphelenchus avenae]
MVRLCETFFALAVTVAVGMGLTTELLIKRVPTATHHTPWKAKLAEWHSKVAKAYNTDPAYLDMQLGAFIANVSVGTPPQNFRVVMDTGSTPFWVVDSKCESTNCKGQPGSGYVKNRFDKSKSSTFKNLGREVHIAYITGAAEGVLVEDTLKKQGLPELVFNIGGRPYPLSPEDYLLPLASGKCALKVYPNDVIGGWLVGDTFMRRYCHVYDIGQRRIGFAEAIN